MKRHWLVILLLLSLGLNLGLGLGILRKPADPPPPAPEERGPRGMGGPPSGEEARRFMGMRLNMMSKSLGLDPDQKDALTALYIETGDAVTSRREAMIDARGDMHERLRAAKDVDAFREILLTHSRLQAELDSIIVNVMMQERSIMRDDQLDRYEEFMLPLGPRRGGPGRGERGAHRGGKGHRSDRGDSGP